jgi:ComF family protein
LLNSPACNQLSARLVCRRVVFSSTIDHSTKLDEPASTVGETRAGTPGLRGNRFGKFVPLLKFSAESLFTTLFPAECRICGDLLQNISRLPVCDDCLDKISRFNSPQCRICGEPFSSTFAEQAEFVCILCQNDKPRYVRAVAYGPYEAGLRDLIHLLKYHSVRSAEATLAEYLATVINSLLPDAGEQAILVPVPLHPSKIGQRGFNQAEQLALAASRRCAATLQVRPDFLKRTRPTISQTGLSQNQRKENIRGAFLVPPNCLADLRGRNIILVDDVFTTGTTVNECSRVLRKAGASQVWVATVARVSKWESVSFFGSDQIRQEEKPTVALGNAAATGN